ncbi:MAG: acyl-CoA dehydrogenase family protein [Acetobacteraceae bacterium]|nr:acyl-CoA dehydrogenase family protein [Acetobacteraceae bacterium]
MTSLLDMKESAIGNVEGPDEAIVDQVLLRIAQLAPMVARLAPDIEQARRLPAELVSALKSARIYGMLIPRRYGGLGLGAPSAFRAIVALARLDGSVGWNAMIGHVGSLMPFLVSPTLCENIFKDRKDHVIAGSGQPVGRAERVPGGWRVSGSWPFASGCQNAEWFGGTCVMMEGGTALDAPDGPGPLIRTCFMPAKHWEIRDTPATRSASGAPAATTSR